MTGDYTGRPALPLSDAEGAFHDAESQKHLSSRPEGVPVKSLASDIPVACGVRTAVPGGPRGPRRAAPSGPELRLITCDGYDPAAGSFDENLVGHASLVHG
ncbi:hypothetical protein ACH9D2_13795 [Kocuria sp. M4R2S49]|uniref:hypothetical protein n=1 Tax=Kocuria rhizosphaericola TaxID=3376284 RepID=UPI0037AC8817